MTHRLLPNAALAALAALLVFGCSDDGGQGATDAGPTGPSLSDTAVSPDASEGDDDASPDADAATPEPTELAITEVTPGRGLASGLEQVEVLGTGFAAGMQVFFGESLAQDIFVLNSRRIVVLTPPRGPGLVPVRVVDPESGAQAALDAAYLYFNPVEISAVDPPTGHVLGGEPVTLHGTGFRPGSTVIFGQTAAISVERLDDGRLLAVTPAGVAIGAVPVHVSNDLGIGTLRDGFLYVDAPTVDRVLPPVGLLAGGETVELVGAGFHDPVTVLFGSRPMTDVELVSGGRVRGVVPAGAALGPVNVTASTEWGTTTLFNGFTYLDDLAPGDVTSLLAISPPHGPAHGGTRATLVAKGLTTAADTAVTFGDVEATVLTVDPVAHTVVVDVPAGAVGPVDVTLSNSRGADTLAAGYTYRPFVRVYEVTPNFGPITGGTAITVSGAGFAAGASVRLGALPASGVQVVDAETLTAVAPPGSPGLANVTVTQGGLADTLVGGYAYQADLALWVITPPQGSQAGGTRIELVGSGFTADAAVTVGGRAATHLEVVSPTLISVKTPPGALGTVPVTVTSSRGTVSLPDGFTYYDPESTYGGTWGEGVAGDVNVTVLDGSNGAPIPDAFVMLWTDPQTPYQGFTNLEGQITFSGPDLAGDQMASASKQGYSSASAVEYDATNLTLYLNPTTPPSPGSPPAVEQPYYNGHVRNLGKAVPVPWGLCANKPSVTGQDCAPCAADTECGEGYRCSQLPGQGSHCTLRCASGSNCADGYACYPLHGVEDQQCVPTAGEVTAFCDFTNSSIFGQDLLPDPGLEARADLSFTIPVPLGEFAVYCWGGVIDRSTDIFTPYALGVHRHVFANPGDQIDGEITLNHPLNRTYSVRLDDVPRGPEGPDINVLFRYLDLGSDGVITFLDQVDSWGAEPFVLDRFLGPLTGDLYDASFTFLAGSFALTATFLPYTMTLHQDIKSLDDDTMYFREQGDWLPRASGVKRNVNALWSAAAGDLIGVGSDGLIIRSLGTSWAQQPSGVTAALQGVHALSSSFAVAVGDGGALTQWDGFAWTKTPSGTSLDLRDVWIGSDDLAYAVGFYTVVRYDGASWTPVTGNTSRNLFGVWGSAPDDIWAVGSFGQIIRYDGAAWLSVPSGTNLGFRAIWGASADDVWMVGEGGTIVRWDGVELIPYEVDTTQTFMDVWGERADSVYAVGARGVVFRWDGAAWSRVNLGGNSRDTTLLAVGGDPDHVVVTGSHELILGPMLAIPEAVQPGDGGLMGVDYKVSWSAQPGVEPHFSLVEVAIPGLLGPVPEWTIVNDWDVSDITLPDFPSIEGTPGIASGPKILTIFRVYREGFDIDNYSNLDLNQFRWRSWSVHQGTFTKQ